ncbi:type II toxin-antitoxin system Phd/YefM family antitoxin [Myxococcota bacterium]|nr:type II toxin-antitoxin system Phd/YefM family antitoxin [Myxococcota bacterium]
MPISASELRADVDNILDRVLESGEPVEIERKGRIVRLVPEARPSKLLRLVRRPGVVVGDPEDLVHLDWPSEWTGEPGPSR